MGAENFSYTAKGKTAKEAFAAARSQAQYDHGHSGYSGTIAEKSEFVMIDVPAGKNPDEYAELLVHHGDERIDDKWGPAGCIEIADGEYLFFGWASS